MDNEILKQKASEGEFEEFTEEFLTYSRSSQLSPTNQTSKKKTPRLKKQQAPKFRIINEGSDSNLQGFFGKSKREKKQISSKAKSIKIGDAIFRSNFESGNLFSVQKVGNNTYSITLQKQLNSDRMSSWFYFACEGLKGQIKFIIKGFTKSSSLYEEGMKICYKQLHSGNKWRRGGSKIRYTDCEMENEEGQRQIYQLQFSFFFKNQLPNTVEFAYCFPYTYSQLLSFLSSHSSKIKVSSLGKSYEGRQIPLLTIGNSESKEVIIISSRVHPGQTVGSLMMEGFLSQLISGSDYGKNLRETFLFKIVPMINPDGVVNGNYRFSSSGYDLNRKWKNCKQKQHPEIYYFRDYIRKISKEKEVIMFIDLHGHSRMKNVFFYGCCPKGSLDTNGNLNTKPKQFPYLMSKIHPPFRYDYCSYAVQKDKQGTARITLWNQLKIDYVYTLESTFCGSQGGSNYCQSDYTKIGGKLCKGICLFFWKKIEKTMKKQNNQEFSENKISIKIAQEFEKNMSQFFENPELAEVELADNGSDSEPQAGQLTQSEKNLRKEEFLKVVKSPKLQKTTTKMDDIKNNEIKMARNNVITVNKNSHEQFKPTSRLNRRDIEKKNINQIKEISSIQNRRFSTRISSRIKENKSNSNTKSHSIYINSAILNKTLNEELHFSKETNENQFKLSENISDQYQSEQLSYANHKKRMKTRRVMGFEGAQYRRIKKYTQDHNRKNFSAYHEDNDEPLIKGLGGGMDGLVDLEKLNIRKGPASFFPTTTVSQNKKVRKGSIQMHFRRQIKATDYSRKVCGTVNVKLEGKHMNT